VPRRRSSTAFGVDIGGSGIKGAIVDLARGDLATERVKYLTPNPSTPEAVAEVVARLVKEAEWTGELGATFPAVIKHGVAKSAANIDKSWIETDVDKVFTDITHCDVTVLNDADAAGIAEVHYGAAAGHPGLVIMTTLGTGIGTAIVYRGVLIPNSELGHLEIDGHDAETRAAASVREREGLSFKEWIPRLQRYYERLEALMWPDLIVIGGGVSKNSEKFIPKLKLNAEVLPANLLNTAGIVGAAWLAADRQIHPDALK
jgi:polyphosphate glucokinase